MPEQLAAFPHTLANAMDKTSLAQPFFFSQPREHIFGNNSVIAFLSAIPQPAMSPVTIPPPSPSQHSHHLTITLLVPGPGPGAPKLLRLTPPVVRHQERPVVLHQRLLQLVFRILVHVFLVVGDDGFGDGLADGVDLGSVPSAGDADADVDGGEFVETDD